MQALRTAATGMAAQQLNVEVISNNIANMNTVGFKKQSAEFEDLLYQTLEQPGAQSSDQGTIVPTGVQIGAGVKAGSVYRITAQGTLDQHRQRARPGDQRPGLLPGAAARPARPPTRAPATSRSTTQGQMVTADGYLVQPTIPIPQNATSVTISQTGQVQVTAGRRPRPRPSSASCSWRPSSTTPAWRRTGNNLFMESAASGPPPPATPAAPGYGVLMQGYTEASNVDPVSEITNLIVAQRAYEMNSKVVTTADQMLSTATNTKSA